MIQNNAQNFPPQQSPVVDEKRLTTVPWSNFFQSLWQRTGAGTGISNKVMTGLTATGLTQATALKLTTDWNEVDTVAANSGVMLPSLQPGQPVMVFNGGANALLVYPATGIQIDALGVNVAYSLATGKTQIFNCWTTILIRSTQLG